MDDLDLRILATMGFTPWGHRPQDPDELRPTNLAKQLDVSPETVRDRIEGMEEAGVIPAWEAYPNPRHVGLSVGAWSFRPEDPHRVDEALEDLLLVDGVIEVITYRGPFVAVALASEGETERRRRLELAGRLLGDPDPVHLFDPPMPPVDREVDRLDLRIVLSLRGRARRPLREVADELGSSYRTVKRRFDRLTSEGSLFLVPKVDLSRVTGILPFTLVALLGDGDPSETVNRLRRHHGERVLHRLAPEGPGGRLVAVGLFADSVAQMEALVRETETLEGIDRAMGLLSKGRHATDWIDGQLEARIRSLA